MHRKKQRMSKGTNIIMNDVSIRLDTLQLISKMLCIQLSHIADRYNNKIHILNHIHKVNFSVTIWLSPFM